MKRMGLMLLLCAAFGCSGDDAPGSPDANTIAFDADGSRTAVVMSTSLGDMVIELEPELMPITTSNFLAYVDAGWYDGTLIHRVDDDWVIQGGGYTTGLVAKTAMSPIMLETNAMVSHRHGAISMARTSDPDSADSQWFICDWPTSGTPPHPGALDGSYAAFGVVIDGLDVLEAITKVQTGNAGGLMDVPVNEIVVTSIRRRAD